MAGETEKNGRMTMGKHAKVYLFLTAALVVFCLFSQTLCARALHFIAYGDTRRDMATREKPQVKHNTIARVIREMEPDFILFSGDMVCYDEFERFLEVVTNNYADKRMIPLYPVIGNHELIFGDTVNMIIKDLTNRLNANNHMDGQASSRPDKDTEKLTERLYRELNAIPEDKLKKRSRQVLCEEIKDKLSPGYTSYLKEVLGEVSEDRSWYSFVKDVNGLRIKFIALNSSLPDDEEQYQWFLNELKQFSGPKIIYQHYPLYSVGHHGCEELVVAASPSARFRDRYTRFFNDISYNVMMVISGHEHSYQRIYRMNKTGDMQFPVYIVSGGGGAPLTGQGTCDMSGIPFDGFRCSGLITAYQFVDVVADTDGKGNLTLNCRVPGMVCDLTVGLPDDDAFARQFTKDSLELLDNFTVDWKK